MIHDSSASGIPRNFVVELGLERESGKAALVSPQEPRDATANLV